MLWAPWLFIVYYAPKVLKLVAVGVLCGVFLAVLLFVASLIANWVWAGMSHTVSTGLLHGWGLTGWILGFEYL